MPPHSGPPHSASHATIEVSTTAAGEQAASATRATQASVTPFIAIDLRALADPQTPIEPPSLPEPPTPDQPPPDQPPLTSPDGVPTEPEIIVTARSRRGDPLEPVNAESFAVTQAVDEALVGPVALAYKKAVPGPIRKGLRNFLSNLREPVVAVNYLLQLKPGKAAETIGRFGINSTVGAAGLFDIAKRRPFKLPRRRNGFANTLGYYGVKPGPFFYLPLIGPTTLRDFVGNTLDQTISPIGLIKPFNKPTFIIPAAVLSALDYRAEFDEEIEEFRASRDPYAASRKYYLDGRQAEIDALRGITPVPIAVPSIPPIDLLAPAAGLAPLTTACVSAC